MVKARARADLPCCVSLSSL